MELGLVIVGVVLIVLGVIPIVFGPELFFHLIHYIIPRIVDYALIVVGIIVLYFGFRE